MRIKFIKFMAKLLNLPEPYFELLPVDPEDFGKLPRTFVSIPTYINWEIVRKGMWPEPDKMYQLFIRQ